ncbi:MAG TPA: SDR family NAD(P)-dependent oxidoreductase [Pyrinomonadaceae bacterium]|nr:SDR family NAD(P)-dependent oxidoreductase [Pyrinomonadaceae bacterium]
MSLASNSVVVITGAASGIGRALAVRFAAEKIAGIVIADVGEEGLHETAMMVEALGAKVSFHLTDVSDLEQVKRLAEEAVQRHGRVTHLINNAGVGLVGTFEQISIEDFRWLMGINFWGVVYGCKVFLPILRQQESGHIVNVSSVFGLIAPEEQTAYCSSKFAIRGFTESLRHELAGTNISVSSVHPGGIKTNIARNAKLGENTPDDWKQQGAQFFDKVARTSPEQAAEVIVAGIKAKEPRILIGKDAEMISLVSRLFPRRYLSILERLSGHKMSLRKKLS